MRSTPVDTDKSVDMLTVLEATGNVKLVKTWLADGSLQGYDKAKTVHVTTSKVNHIRGLSNVLRKLERLPNRCVIRGKLRPREEAFERWRAKEHRNADGSMETFPDGKMAYRRLEFFEDQPLHSLMIDFDKVAVTVDPINEGEAAVLSVVRDKLPVEFHDVSFHWQLSNSVGHPSRNGALSAHVWFWSHEPVGWAELDASLGGRGLDESVFRTVQPLYTGSPCFADGVVDPVRVRSGLWRGARDEVALPAPKVAVSVPAIGDTATTADGTRPGPVPPLGRTHDQIRRTVAKISPEGMGHQEWRRLICGTHHETSGSDFGFDVIHEWCMANSGDYYTGADALQAQWDACSSKRDYVTTFRAVEDMAGGEDMTAELAALALPPNEDTKVPLKLLRGPATAYVGRSGIVGPWEKPEVIVANYMLGDSGGIVSPGGLGKTTLSIFEAVHIILGKPLWGREIVKPGKVVFLTAEDSAATVRSRLNRICAALNLTDAELDRVGAGFALEDVSTVSARMVVSAGDGVFKATRLVYELAEAYRGEGVSYLHADPVSLLGPGELFGNDGAGELHRAAGRYLARELGCAVRWVHHTGQAVAREGIHDQYAGRGGTAFADNARFIHQLDVIKKRQLTFEGVKFEVPSGVEQHDIESGNLSLLMVHKLSYERRDREPILILREGFQFSQVLPDRTNGTTSVAQDIRDLEKICDFLQMKIDNGVRLSVGRLEGYAADLGLKRDRVRNLVNEALSIGRIIWIDLPPNEVKGGYKQYLQPRALPESDL